MESLHLMDSFIQAVEVVPAFKTPLAAEVEMVVLAVVVVVLWDKIPVR
jgi:hypothetical protein